MLKRGWMQLAGYGCAALSGLGCVRAADDDSQSLRAEIQAMRAAYESRISALEVELKEIKNRPVPVQKPAGQRLNEAAARIEPAGALVEKGLAVRAGDAGNPVQGSTQLTLGGYTEFAYVNRGENISGFDQLKTVAQLSAKIDERISVYLEAEHEHGATIEPGEDTGGELETEQAYLDYQVSQAVNFRAGIVLVPVGRYNLFHEGYVNNFVDRPLVNQRIIPTTWFEEGIGFHGTPVDNGALGLSYEVYALNPGRPETVASPAGFREIRNEGKAPESGHHAGAARVAFEPLRSWKSAVDIFEIGISGYASGFNGFKGEDEAGTPIHLKDGLLTLGAFDLTCEKNNIGLRAEAAWANAGAGAAPNGRSQRGFGYYTEAICKFWPKFLSSSPFGKFKDPQLAGALRWEQTAMNDGRFDHRNLDRLTFGLSYRPLPNTAFKFDYQLDFASPRQDTFSETGRGRKTDAFLFGLTTAF